MVHNSFLPSSSHRAQDQSQRDLNPCCSIGWGKEPFAHELTYGRWMPQ